MIFYTNNQEYINRQQYRDLCLLSTRTDPFALSNNPKKYKSYTQEYWENKIKQSKSKKIFIALNNNEIIGTITGRKQENNGFLSILYVNPLYRGRGIAKELIKSTITYLQNAGCNKIYLRVNKSQEAAISLYQKLGFTEIDKKLGKKVYPNSITEKKKYFMKDLGVIL